MRALTHLLRGDRRAFILALVLALIPAVSPAQTDTPTSTPTPTPTPTATITPVTPVPPPRQLADAASWRTRVQGTTATLTLRTGRGILRRVSVSNNNAAVQTLTLTIDGVNHVIQVPTKTTLSIEFGVAFSTSLAVAAGSTDIDALVIFD